MTKIGPEPAPAARLLELRPRRDCAWPGKFDKLFDALHFQYGYACAVHISRGMDRRTNADLDAWRRLGSR